MPERERLERPQASLLEDIEAEMAEEAALKIKNVEGLLKWKKRQAWLTLGIFACLLLGLFMAVPLALLHPDAYLVGILLGGASVFCAIGSFVIALIKPDIYRIAPDGTTKSQKAAKYSFFFFWLTQGGFILVILLLIGIVIGIASLF